MTGGWRALFTAPEPAEPGVRWMRRASHLQHGLARSGIIYATDDVLGFQPWGWDQVLGARAVTWPLRTAADMKCTLAGRRLKLRLTFAGRRERFVVSDPALVVSSLPELIVRAGGGPS